MEGLSSSGNGSAAMVNEAVEEGGPSVKTKTLGIEKTADDNHYGGSSKDGEGTETRVGDKNLLSCRSGLLGIDGSGLERQAGPIERSPENCSVGFGPAIAQGEAQNRTQGEEGLGSLERVEDLINSGSGQAQQVIEGSSGDINVELEGGGGVVEQRSQKMGKGHRRREGELEERRGGRKNNRPKAMG